MTKPPHKSALYPAREFGPLPVATINATLGTELGPGTVHLSVKAHHHIAADHPADYPVCWRHLGIAVASPTFLGLDPKHAHNFTLVKDVGLASGFMLVAIGMAPNPAGNYGIKSMLPDFAAVSDPPPDHRPSARGRPQIDERPDTDAEPSVTRAGCNPGSLGRLSRRATRLSAVNYLPGQAGAWGSGSHLSGQAPI
jgi:hypothetical protein